MAAFYTYNKTDFVSLGDNNINICVLQLHIADTLPISYINLSKDGEVVIVSCHFPGELSVGDKAILDAKIATFVYTPPPFVPIPLTIGASVSNDPANPGDFTSVSAAFAAGNKSVFVKNGTYVETSDVIIPDGGQLEGELPGKVYIMFSGAKGIIVDGSGGVKETVGTISVNNGSKVVAGVGTTFTNLAPGKYILIGTNYFVIQTIESATSLTLKETYLGVSVSGSSYIAQSMYSGCRITNLIVIGSASTGFYIRALRHGSLGLVGSFKNNYGVKIIDSSDLGIKSVIVSFNAAVGITIDNSVTIAGEVFDIFNCGSHGIVVTGTSANVVLKGVASEHNNGVGILITGTTSNSIIESGICNLNNAGGLHIDSSVNKTIVSNMVSHGNNVYGILSNGFDTIISSSLVCNNIGNGVELTKRARITSSDIDNNAGNGVEVGAGAGGAILSGNDVEESGSHGIVILASDVSATNNTVVDSGGDGIKLGGTTANTRVIGNHVSTNVAAGINVSGTNSNVIIANNIASGNGTSGILVSADATYVIVSANNALGNTGTNLVDASTGAIVSNNFS